jgi:hypothetical protein
MNIRPRDMDPSSTSTRGCVTPSTTCGGTGKTVAAGGEKLGLSLIPDRVGLAVEGKDPPEPGYRGRGSPVTSAHSGKPRPSRGCIA